MLSRGREITHHPRSLEFEEARHAIATRHAHLPLSRRAEQPQYEIEEMYPDVVGDPTRLVEVSCPEQALPGTLGRDARQTALVWSGLREQPPPGYHRCVVQAKLKHREDPATRVTLQFWQQVRVPRSDDKGPRAPRVGPGPARSLRSGVVLPQSQVTDAAN